MKSILIGMFMLPAAIVAAEVSAAKDSASVSKNEPAFGTREHMRRKLGGVIAKPNSQKGHALVINAQDSVAESNLTLAVDRVMRDSRMNIVVKSVAPDAIDDNWSALREKENAAVLVVVLNKKNLPPLTVVPDERWAVVNVANLEKDLMRPQSKEKFLPLRTRRQVLRALALIAGSGRKGVESPSAVNSIAELDQCRDALPMDVVDSISGFFEHYGMTRKKFTTYRQACREGWAPAPTNDIQKAIWDKVHELPTKPIKILPETKKVKD